MAISPDGKRISLTAFREGQAVKILTLDGDGTVTGVESPSPPGDGFALHITDFSPDGRRAIGELRDPSYRPQGIGVYDFESRTHRRLTTEGLAPVWLDTGRILYGSDGDGDLWLLDVDRGGAARLVYALPSGEFSSRLMLSPDRKSLYFGRAQRESDIWMLALPGSARP